MTIVNCLGAMIRSVYKCLYIDVPRINSGQNRSPNELRCLGRLKEESGCRSSSEPGLILVHPDSTSESEG
jgi:hypothetical protein